MAKSILTSCDPASQTLPTHGNSYTYAPSTSGPVGNFAVEANSQIRVREPGIFSNLKIKIISNTTVTATTRFRSRINGVNGNLLISIPPGVTGYLEDLTNTDVVVAGDLYNFKIQADFEWFKQVIYTAYGSLFTPNESTDTISIISPQSFISDLASTILNFFSLWGQTAFLTTEGSKQDKILGDFTARNAGVYTDFNSLDAECLVTLRINGVNTSVVVTIPAGTTGHFEDIVNTAAVSKYDLVSWGIQSPSRTSGTFSLIRSVINFDSATSKFIGGCGQGSRAITGATRYFALCGINAPSSSEAVTQFESNFDWVLEGLTIYIDVNSHGSDSTLTSRINGVDGNNEITIPAATTGWFDIEADDNILTGDLFNSVLRMPASSGLNISNIDWVGTPFSAPTGTIIVQKITIPSGLLTDFDFTASGGLSPTSFSLQDGESQIFSGLAAAGGYSIVETPEAGFTTTVEVSNDPSNDNTNITVGPGETVTVIFTNTRNAIAGSGIYKLVPDKRNDTLWVDPIAGTTEIVKIPDPFIDGPIVGS